MTDINYPLLAEFGIQRGIYGELIPPPFYVGVTPDEAIEQLSLAVRQKSGETLHQPTRGKSRAGLERLAALRIHQQRFLQVLSGDLPDPAGMALRILVEDANEPLSLRPCFLDDLHHLSFIPVMQRTGEDSWQIGLPNRGKSVQFQADSILTAYVMAQGIYNRWVDDEQAMWKKQVSRSADSTPSDIHTLCWELDLRAANHTTINDNYILQRWDGHGQYALRLPNKQVFLFQAHSYHLATIYTKIMLSQKADFSLSPLPFQTVYNKLKKSLPELNRSTTGFVCGGLTVVPSAQRISVIQMSQDKAQPVGFSQPDKNGALCAYKQQKANQSPKIHGKIVLPASWEPEQRSQFALLWTFFQYL